MNILALLLLPLLFQTPATTVQAESMTIVAGNITGANSDAVLIFGASGGPATLTGSVAIPVAATYNIVVVATGTPLGGVFPNVDVLIDGARVGGVTVNSGTFANFTIPNVPLAAGAHPLVLSFTNDAVSDTEDRNVTIDRVDFLTATITPVQDNPATSVTLQWDPNADATLAGYRVYRSATSMGYGSVPIATVAVGATPTFTNAGLTVGLTYYYVVTAFLTGGTGESGFSNEIAIKVTNPVKAVPPGHLRKR